jgi:hypothetical protein
VSPDKHATTACVHTRAADIFEAAGRVKRAATFEASAEKAAARSSVPRLREAVADPARTGGVALWCSLHLPDITDDNVGRYLPRIRKELKKIRDTEAKRSGSGNGGFRNGSRGGRSGWRR